MSIDEAIEKNRKIAETKKTLYDACILEEYNRHLLREYKEHEQLAEWLEELKEYKEKPEGWMWDEAERKGYNKAIYDFTRILHHEEFDNAYGVNIVLTPQQVDEIAQQLKVGD